MRTKSLWFSLAGLGVGLFVACSADPPIVNVGDTYTPYGLSGRNPYTGIHSRSGDASRWEQEYGNRASTTASVGHAPVARPVYGSTQVQQVSRRTQSPSSLYSQVNVKRDYLSYGARGRSRKSMNPRYVTIHSTQNWSRGADSNRHSLALKRGALGRLSWHYTTDDKQAVQHLPTTEQGNHADYDGPGNRYSIGIEMCEHPGNSRSATLERTAKLAAWLCVKHNIPVDNVVPHYKWPRHGKKPANKNCPHFLLTNGKPGTKWRNFVNVVRVYHRAMTGR